MFELLSILLPDFSLLWTDEFEREELAVYFLILMGIIVFGAAKAIHYHYRNFNARVSAIESLVDTEARAQLAVDRQNTLEKALNLSNQDAGNLWREFDESLVYSSDKKYLYNTLDAEHFFNSHSLATGLTSSRLLAATPSFLTAIGVLGTFIGLTLGLQKLNVNTNDAEALKAGVAVVIQSAAVAFMTSVWGVGLSLLVNFAEKLIERTVLTRITVLQRRIDYLYPRIPAEQSLVHIADATRESKDALLELHERIGDRLQESVDKIQVSVVDALGAALGPALDKLAESANKQSSEALQQLINQFSEGLTERGNKAKDDLNSAADNIDKAMGGVSARLNDVVATADELAQKQRDAHQQSMDEQRVANEKAIETQRQLYSASFEEQRQLNAEFSKSQQEYHQKAIERQDSLSQTLAGLEDALAETTENLEATAEKLVSATEGIGKSASAFDDAAEKLSGITTKMGEYLPQLTGDLAEAAAIVEELTETNAALTTGLQQSVAQITKTVEALQATSRTADTIFARLSTHNQEFHAELKSQIIDMVSALEKTSSKLVNQLGNEVKTLEAQLDKWLQGYTDKVSDQIQHRMKTWDEESLRFAKEMQRTTNAISNLVDEIDGKFSTPVNGA